MKYGGGWERAGLNRSNPPEKPTVRITGSSVLFLTPSGGLRSLPVLQHDLPDHCENSNPDHYGPEGGLMTEKGGALFGYTDLYGGYDGGQAEFVRVPCADSGP